MAVLSRDEARRARAAKHAERGETCACGRVIHGNGRATHQRACEPYLRAYGWPLADATVEGLRAQLREDHVAIDNPGGAGRRPVYASDVLFGIQRRIAAVVLARRAEDDRRPLGWRELGELLPDAYAAELAEVLAAHGGTRWGSPV